MLDELDRRDQRPRAGPTPDPATLHLRYDRADLALVRAARQSARLLAGPLGATHADAVELLVDELLTNAFVHGAPAFRHVVTRRADDTVVEVHDEHPAITFRWHEAEHRGLRIADRLSRGVEVEATASGKCVRAVVPADPWSTRRPGPTRRRRRTRAPRDEGEHDG